MHNWLTDCNNRLNELTGVLMVVGNRETPGLNEI